MRLCGNIACDCYGMIFTWLLLTVSVVAWLTLLFLDVMGCPVVLMEVVATFRT